MREDWIKTTLGEVCFTTSGGTPSRRNDNYYNGSIPWVKSGELDKGIIYETEEYITEEAIKSSSAKLFPKGTLLIALYGATIGKLAFLGTEATTNQAICGIFENDNINSKFLYHYLFYKKRHLIGQGTGGAQPNISQTILKKLKLPLPPLPEQRTIVAKIEQLFSELDNGIANLKTAQEQLKVYRQAVLKKAFEGELTIKNEKEDEVLIAAEPDVRYGKNSLANKWQEYPFSDILILRKDKHKPEKIENKFYIGLEHIEKETGRLTDNVGFEEIKTVKNKFYKGDILYGKLRPYLNKAYLAKEDGVCSTDILVFKPTKNVLGNLMIHYFLGRKFVNDMSENTSGVNLPRVSTKYVENHKILLPNIRKQHQIVQQIESRLSVCDKVEETITENLQKAEALRQSILKKAFSGELLTEAEIAACKMEKDWEPAGELLKRIKNKN